MIYNPNAQESERKGRNIFQTLADQIGWQIDYTDTPQIRNLQGLVGFCLQSDKIHFIVHISCTTEMSQTQNPLTP